MGNWLQTKLESGACLHLDGSISRWWPNFFLLLYADPNPHPTLSLIVFTMCKIYRGHIFICLSHCTKTDLLISFTWPSFIISQLPLDKWTIMVLASFYVVFFFFFFFLQLPDRNCFQLLLQIFLIASSAKTSVIININKPNSLGSWCYRMIWLLIILLLCRGKKTPVFLITCCTIIH